MDAERRGDTFVMRDAGQPIDFSTFLVGLASSALIHLGQAPHPETGGAAADLVLARQTLDLLSLLRGSAAGSRGWEADQGRGRWRARRFWSRFYLRPWS